MTYLHHALANPWALWLLTILPALALLGASASGRRRRALLLFNGRPALELLAKPLWRKGKGWNWRHALLALCFSGGATALILGVAGPRWGEERGPTLAPGHDLVAVLDLSRSMLARDVPGPTSTSRLGQAVEALNDLGNKVEKRGGHRLALVVFAARARVVCPLTQDYDHFREALSQLDPFDPLLDISPTPNSASGTRIGEGLQKAVELLHDSPLPGYQSVLLISDGDDPGGDEEWRSGASIAKGEKIPVHTVGVGDPERASPIPIPGYGNLQFHGEIITTRLQEKPLQEIAHRTGGTYTPGRTKALPLGDLLQAGREFGEDILPVYRLRYAWFYAVALALLAMHLAIGEGRRQGPAIKVEN
jgi:Ca-activated chloride channel family protein